MNVLSIDIDFISSPSIELYSYDISGTEDPHLRWQEIFSETGLKESDLNINPHNIMFIQEIFLKALEYNPKVDFGLTHDSILFELMKFKDKVNIINIDHHHDIYYDNNDGKHILKYNYPKESTWVKYLQNEEKLNSYTWIHNTNSNLEGLELLEFTTPTIHTLKEDFSLDTKIDYIYLCLSPQYLPKIHWFYFFMLKNMYEIIKNKKININTEKYLIYNDLKEYL